MSTRSSAGSRSHSTRVAPTRSGPYDAEENPVRSILTNFKVRYHTTAWDPHGLLGRPAPYCGAPTIPEPPIGFWSYVQSDNENSRQRIRRLADLIRAEFSLITGEELRLFTDRDIEWGQHWEARIDQALRAVTFLIPIITPSYFKSEACRKELLTFSGHASSRGLDELLLPIYYVPVPALDEHREGVDQAVDLIAKTQWRDWRDLRLTSEDDPAYLEAINGAAMRLADIAALAELPIIPTRRPVWLASEAVPALRDFWAAHHAVAV